MALYTGAYGGMLGGLFFLITLWAKKIAGDKGCVCFCSWACAWTILGTFQM